MRRQLLVESWRKALAEEEVRFEAACFDLGKHNNGGEPDWLRIMHRHPYHLWQRLCSNWEKEVLIDGSCRQYTEQSAS